MSIFPEDKHLEVFIKPNKTSAPPDSTPVFVQALVVSLPIALAMSLSLVEEMPVNINTDFTYNPYENRAERGVTAESNYTYTEDPVYPSETAQALTFQGPASQGNSSDLLAESSGATVSNTLLRPYTISIPQFCNDAAIAGANFQSQPTSVGTATQGIIAAGTEVTLTGATAYGDGIIWFQAVNKIALTPSDQPEAQNKTEPYQIGWIADCFVRGSGYF